MLESDNPQDRFAYLTKPIKPHKIKVGDTVVVTAECHIEFDRSGKVEKVTGNLLTIRFDSQTTYALVRDVRCTKELETKVPIPISQHIQEGK